MLVLDFDFEGGFEDQGKNHRNHKEINYPVVGTVGPAGSIGVIDADSLDGWIGGEGFFEWVLDDVGEFPAGAEGADFLQAGADVKVFVVILSSNVES